jgi:DNA replication and repair protein RecF
LLTVQFVPEDMEIFTGSPGGRRRLIDEVLCQVSVDYQRSLKTYDQALRRRNKLIMALREGNTDRYAFFYWDQLLIEHGAVLHEWRVRFLEWLNAQPQWQTTYQLYYDHSVMSEARLHQYAQAEVGAGHTLVGPHLDDWQLRVWRGGEWRSIAHYGSRGEQRLALIWWKLGEVAYLHDYHQRQPVVLLDDILSELDGENGSFLFSHLEQQQCLITTTANHLPTLKDIATNIIELKTSV